MSGREGKLNGVSIGLLNAKDVCRNDQPLKLLLLERETGEEKAISSRKYAVIKKRHRVEGKVFSRRRFSAHTKRGNLSQLVKFSLPLD